MKPLVYIASPYTKGDVGRNVKFQHRIFDELLERGLVTPIAPLWSHYQHIHYPRTHAEWVGYDMELLARADALLRLDATDSSAYPNYNQHESAGADQEVAFMRGAGKPVFWSVEDVHEWARLQNVASSG